MNKIFLTGHRGFIGRHLYAKLLQLGHSVYTDLRELSRQRFDYIVHLAAVTHIRTEFDPEIFESNVVLAKQIMTNPARIVYASSCSSAHLTNPYAYTKRYLEWLGVNHGNATGLRFHNVYGPENTKGVVRFLMHAEDGQTLTIRGPELIRDYIHVDDVVREIIRRLPSHYEKARTQEFSDVTGRNFVSNVGIFDVGTGMGTKTIDLVNLFMKVSGKKFVLEFQEAGENEPKEMISDIACATIPLEEGLKKTIEADESFNSRIEL